MGAGGHELVVEYGARSIATIAIDGAPLFPPDCVRAHDGLCSARHRRLRSVDGKGVDLVLAGQDVDADRAYLLFAAIFVGSPECGAYGY